MTSSAPPLGIKDKERQHLALPDPALELDEDRGAIVEGAQWPPWRRMTEVEQAEVESKPSKPDTASTSPRCGGNLFFQLVNARSRLTSSLRDEPDRHTVEDKCNQH